MLITDNHNNYNSFSGEKILIGNGHLISGNVLSDEAITEINRQMNGYEIRAAEDMITELRALCQLKPEIQVNANPFLNTRSQFDIRYSLLYQDFKIYVLKRNVFDRMLELVSEKVKAKGDQIEFYLHNDYQLLADPKRTSSLTMSSKFSFYGPTPKVSPVLKNLYYSLHSFLHTSCPVKTQKTHIALFVFDIASEVEIFDTFFKIVAEREDLELSIIQISSGVPAHKVVSAAKYEGDNIHFFEFKDFKSPVQTDDVSFTGWLNMVDPYYGDIFGKAPTRHNLAVYYAFAAKCFKRIQPDIAVYANTAEAGRAISDVGRTLKIPVINVEYALFTDDAIHMESNILFSARACIGESGIGIWKKRNDPTPKHEAIGFIKLDKPLRKSDAKNFIGSLGFDPALPTIFFASTWAGTNDLYNKEKMTIVERLIDFCEQQKVNMIIKKHPAETDGKLNELVKGKGSAFVKVFEHGEIELQDALRASEILITQNSSVSAEAIFYGKPTVFINLSQGLIWPELFPFIGEEFIFNIRDLAELEKRITFILKNSTLISQKMSEHAGKYLFKPDGNASKRLLDLCLRLKNMYES